MTTSGEPLTQLSSWRISSYPDAKAFGFTIVHDADGAYSQRLAPIIEAFDQIGLLITVTVFPFWADWGDPDRSWREWRSEDPFFAPVCVPLEDEAERAFYLDVGARGHEIAMHTPSETSSVREDVIRAFALFRSIFGRPPHVYVEHSPGNNLDAQTRCGSDPASPYYNTDLLNEAGCWVWVCDCETSFAFGRERQLDVLSDPSGPFCPRAREKFGIARAFLRSPTRPSDGNGFLSTFTEDVFDKLESDRGLSLVYTHLNNGWLDPHTRTLRADILDRLTSSRKTRRLVCACRHHPGSFCGSEKYRIEVNAHDARAGQFRRYHDRRTDRDRACRLYTHRLEVPPAARQGRPHHCR